MARQILLRTRRIRASAHRLTEEAYNKRRTYFTDATNGLLSTAAKSNADDNNLANAMLMSNPMMDPGNMSSMMKKNMMMLVTNMVFFTWIDRSFAGFISGSKCTYPTFANYCSNSYLFAVKLPFGLTQGFKDMFQRGIDLQGLGVSYVSSMSWYILTLTGLRGVTTLILGQNNGMNRCYCANLKCLTYASFISCR